MKKTLIIGLLFGTLNAPSWPENDTLPPMGWEPWNIDHCGDTLSKWDDAYYYKLADYFVSSGLRDLGYTYLTIECNDHFRDKNGKWTANPAKFPNGYKPVIEYIHSKGLKVRAYTDAGKGKCCCFDEGSYGHYEEDAKVWIENDFDGVKIDWCGGNNEKLDPKTQFIQIATAVKKYSNSFSIEICTWGKGKPWEWGTNAGSLWRTSGDIDDCGKNGFIIGGCWFAVERNIYENRHIDRNLYGPGKGWNYPDMLLVGVKGGLNEKEERSQFSMWAMMASPLFLGNDVFNMNKATKETLFNKELIDIDQDKLGMQGDVMKEFNNGLQQIWCKELYNGSKAVALLNRDETPAIITVKWSDLKISGNQKIRDLWDHANKPVSNKEYTAKVDGHGVVVLKIMPVK